MVVDEHTPKSGGGGLTMRSTYRSARLTYRALFSYSLVIVILIMIAVPVLANATPASKLLDFSFSAEETAARSKQEN